MQYKKRKKYMTFLLSFVLTSLQAQSLFFVKEKSGIQTQYTTAGIRTITFTSDYVIINKKDGNINVSQRSNVCSLNFGNTTASIEDINNPNANNLMLYPNPVIHQLHVQYSTTSVDKVQIQIIDIQGGIILEQSFDGKSGLNDVIISVAQIQHGLYFCRLLYGNKVESSKFIKY